MIPVTTPPTLHQLSPRFHNTSSLTNADQRHLPCSPHCLHSQHALPSFSLFFLISVPYSGAKNHRTVPESPFTKLKRRSATSGTTCRFTRPYYPPSCKILL